MMTEEEFRARCRDLFDGMGMTLPDRADRIDRVVDEMVEMAHQERLLKEDHPDQEPRK